MAERDDWAMGALAAYDKYSPEEGNFQAGVRATPWFSEYQNKYSEEPNLNTPDYDYRAAWKAGARPEVRDPGDSLLHWPSQFKGQSHPNRYVNGVDTITGVPLDEGAAAQSAAEAAAARTRRPYRGLPAAGTSPLPENLLAAADFMMPSSLSDVAMMALPGGAVARALTKAGGRALRAGVGTAGVYGAMSDEAEAHGLTKAAKKAMGAVLSPSKSSDLFDYSRLHEVPAVTQFDLPRNVPPRGVPQRTLDITSDPAVRDKMLEVVSQGQKMGGANWYNAEPLRAAFNTELGSGGDAAFRKYMDMVAATSPRSDVGSNVRNASYYYGRAARGEPMPAVGDKNPQPYGHMAQRLHQMNAERVAGPGWDPLNNPKPASFVENLVGNQAPATIDTHAFRLPAILGRDPRFLETAFQVNKDAPKQNIQKMLAGGEVSLDDAAGRAAYWQAQPKANEYAAIENYYKSIGKELGLTPAQTQASAWVGGGKLTGLASDESKPFLRFFEDRVNLTAEKRGEAPKKVLQDFIRGKAPLLTVPPIMGTLAAQDRYQPEER